MRRAAPAIQAPAARMHIAKAAAANLSAALVAASARKASAAAAAPADIARVTVSPTPTRRAAAAHRNVVARVMVVCPWPSDAVAANRPVRIGMLAGFNWALLARLAGARSKRVLAMAPRTGECCGCCRARRLCAPGPRGLRAAEMAPSLTRPLKGKLAHFMLGLLGGLRQAGRAAHKARAVLSDGAGPENQAVGPRARRWLVGRLAAGEDGQRHPGLGGATKRVRASWRRGGRSRVR